MEKREKAVLKRERREQRKQAGPATFPGPSQQADVAETESEPDPSVDGESS